MFKTIAKSNRFSIAMLIATSIAPSQTIPDNLKPGSVPTPQQTMDKNMANAKDVADRKEKEKEKQKERREAQPDPHDGRLRVGKGVSLGGSVKPGEITGNIKVDLPAGKSGPPAQTAKPYPAPAAKPATAPAAKPAPAPAAPASARPQPERTRDFIDHSRPSVRDAGVGHSAGNKA